MEGAKSQGFDTEIINLSTLNYKGCVSCFYCKRKDKPHGICALKDDLSPVLEKLAHADMLIFGSPIYYDTISSGMAAFLERFLFSNFLYSFEIPTVFPKVMPTGFIYSMNITKPQMESVHISSNLHKYQESIATIVRFQPEILYVYNTYQFSDYSKYEASMFSEEDKRRQREEQFPLDCRASFDMGAKLAMHVKETAQER